MKNAQTALRRMRLATGMSQVQFASKCNVSVATMNALEQGWRKPSLPTMTKICRVLVVDPGKLNWDPDALRAY